MTHTVRDVWGGVDLVRLAEPDTFAANLAPLRKTVRVAYAKPSFGGSDQVLVYMSRYAHRVAISNHRPVCVVPDTVAFRWKTNASSARIA
ncbi:transposase [Rhodobacteraceae bacterium M382]|nr:transposase [Rhodobacteraceae bacterium M382]